MKYGIIFGDIENACEKSGMSILEYSKRNNLSPRIISFWRLTQQRLSGSKFEEVVLLGPLSGALTVEYPTGIKIHLDPAADLSFIKALLHC
ncbi:MAG: hypothetical protein IPH94_03520 [Saprospiraceae bacterium]|nr:hypothetical protein [Saprospiraceae bacterium]